MRCPTCGRNHLSDGNQDVKDLDIRDEICVLRSREYDSRTEECALVSEDGIEMSIGSVKIQRGGERCKLVRDATT